MNLNALTGNDNYFEDFAVGQVIQHGRGKTITEMDNVLVTQMTMNTAQAHFNEHLMQDSTLGQRVVFGGCTISLVVGLASQDTSENALMELGMDKVRLKAPVFHGDTLYAYTEVLQVLRSDQEEAGEVLFKHWGVNQDRVTVFEGERRCLIKCRNYPVGIAVVKG